MNQNIIKNFETLIKQLKVSSEKNAKYKIKSFQNVISILRKYPHEITSEKELEGTPGIGSGTLERIKEIIETGSLKELVKLPSSTLLQFQEEIGEKTALKLQEIGITDLQSLKQAVDEGKIEVDNRVQLLLKYHFGPVAFREHIPRSEMKVIDKYLESTLKEYDNKVEYIVCGSYRREKPFSNDIDVLIFKEDDSIILSDLIQFLSEQEFLVDHLTHHIEKLKTVYRGYAKSPIEKNVVRRIDIRFVEYRSKAPAIMYFTGSKDFNTKIRIIAKDLGYKLNEYHLAVLDSNVVIYPSSEEDIFKFLKMDYVPPSER